MGATIADVAKLAGVSKATVSRVINNHSVRPATRSRVLQAMRQLDYQPNVHARGLTSGKSSVVGVIVPGIANQFYGAILDGVQSALDTRGYHMIVTSTGHTVNARGKEWMVAKLLKEKRADGVLVVTPRVLSPEHFMNLIKSNFPVVLADGHSDALSCVIVDNFEGASKAVNHLIQLGHRDIALVTGPPETTETVQRLSGYKAALEAAGLPLREEWVISSDYTYQGGVKAAEQILAQKGRKPTAVFAANDYMAMGVINYLVRCGLRVPEDVAVVGYDDIESAAFFRPALTTVRQPLMELGKVAAHKLLSVVEGTETETVKILLSAELVVRESSGAPRASANASIGS